MHNTSNIKRQGKYWSFRIPKKVLDVVKWSHGDLLGFSGFSGKVIHLQRLCKSEDFKFLPKNSPYKKYCKRISKFGGAGIVLGIKSFPQPLLDEFKPEHNQTMYFRPAKGIWYEETYGDRINDVILVSFDKEKLNDYYKPPKEEDYELKERKFLVKKYKPPFFKNKLELTEKNNTKARNKVVRVNRQIHKDKLKGLKHEIKRAEGYIDEVSRSNHPRKQEMIEDHQRTKQQLKGEYKKFCKKTTKVFKEWDDKKGNGRKAKN